MKITHYAHDIMNRGPSIIIRITYVSAYELISGVHTYNMFYVFLRLSLNEKI